MFEVAPLSCTSRRLRLPFVTALLELYCAPTAAHSRHSRAIAS
jgi:hypothetical protein